MTKFRRGINRMSKYKRFPGRRKHSYPLRTRTISKKSFRNYQRYKVGK